VRVNISNRFEAKCSRSEGSKRRFERKRLDLGRREKRKA
jgi:hypothetical protein